MAAYCGHVAKTSIQLRTAAAAVLLLLKPGIPGMLSGLHTSWNVVPGLHRSDAHVRRTKACWLLK